MQLARPKSGRDGRRSRRSNSFAYFRRVLSYARPHRGRLIPGLICIALVAASSSVGLALALPVLQAIIRPEAVPVWIFRTTAARRLHADIDTFVSDESDDGRLREFDRRPEVTRLEEKSALRLPAG